MAIPKPKQANKTPPAPKNAEMDKRLRQITVRVMEELKRPDAIPSQIIYRALEEARHLG